MFKNWNESKNNFKLFILVELSIDCEYSFWKSLIPFPRIGKRQSLIPFPRIGRSGPPPAQSDAAELYDDAQGSINWSVEVHIVLISAFFLDGIGQQEDDNAQQVYYFPSRLFNVATGPKVSANDY